MKNKKGNKISKSIKEELNEIHTLVKCALAVEKDRIMNLSNAEERLWDLLIYRLP